jgi:hypothetical protein
MFCNLFLAIHIFDYFLYQFTFNRLDMWKIIDPKTRIAWSKSASGQKRLNWAIVWYTLYYLAHLSIMLPIVFTLNSHKLCDPFVGIYIFTDFGFTVAVQLMVLVEN